MKFDIFLCPIDNEISGLELGGMSIRIKDKEFSTKKGQKPQLMMIFLALSDLLDGLKNLWIGQYDTFNFVGTDSSFTIMFRRKNNVLYITHDNEIVDIDFKVFIDESFNAVEKFYLKYYKEVSPDDAALCDLKNSLMNLKKKRHPDV